VIWNGLVRGGRYELEPEGSYRAPVFTFDVLDVDAVEAFFDDHYVHFEVRWGDDDKMAYFMSAPDLSPDVAAIPVPATDHIWVASGQMLRGGHTTILRDKGGGRLALDRFTNGLYHDWTQSCAQADKSLRLASGARAADYLAHARKVLETYHSGIEAKEIFAHHLFARVWAALGEREMAVYHLAQAVRRAVVDRDDYLLPAASAPLFDLARAFVADGERGRAAACLHHALAIRPKFRAARGLLAELASPPYAGGGLGQLEPFEKDAGFSD